MFTFKTIMWALFVFVISSIIWMTTGSNTAKFINGFACGATIGQIPFVLYDRYH